MIWLGYFFIVILIFLNFVLQAGEVDMRLFRHLLAWSIILIIPFYFMSRENRAATRTEASLAWLWILLRRLVGILGFVMIGSICVALTIKGLDTGFSWGGVASVIFSLFMSFFILWKCWYGEGTSRDFSDDRPSHEAKKRRYGWK